MNIPKVSIIVPVYNTEPYLKDCFDSLVGQTYQNLEILLVDDGSTDGSAAVCDQYQNKYPNVRVVHKENGGCGSARNYALDHLVTGDFVLDMDSDDWLVPETCEQMVKYAQEYNADIVHCEVFKDPNNRRVVKEENPCVLSRKESLETFLNDRVRSGAIKLFRRDLIQDTRFPLRSSIDDMEFLSDLLERTKTIVVSSLELYYYRYNREGNLSTSTTRFVRNVYERYKEFLKRYAIAQKCGVYGEEAFQKAVEHALVFYAHYEVAGQWKAERAEVETFIKENKKKIQQFPLLDRRTKTKCRVLNFNKRLFALLSKIFRRKG